MTDIILCSYFLPGHELRKQLEKAITRGIKVRIMIAGPSDVMLAKNAERYMYDWLLRKGVAIYEYKRNVLHGKVAVCDDQWMTIGSYNVNDISAYASVELNLDVYNATLVSETREMLEEIIARDCIPVTLVRHRQSKSIVKQFIRWVSYRVIRVVFYLFTFYFKQRAY